MTGRQAKSDMRLVVAGAAGRMGRTLVRLISETPGVTLSGALEREGSPALGQDAGVLAGLPPLGVTLADDPLPLLIEAEGILDFTSPASTVFTSMKRPAAWITSTPRPVNRSTESLGAMAAMTSRR